MLMHLIGCPYHFDGVWKNLKANDKASFLDTLNIDVELRSNAKIMALTPRVQAYLHPSHRPLALVDFSNATRYQNQMNEECEGLCGI